MSTPAARRPCIAWRTPSRAASWPIRSCSRFFDAGRPEHVDHLTAFTAESFGGSDRFTRELGFGHLIDVHRGLRISKAQRARFVELYMAALDASGMPADEPFRDAVRSHVEFGSRVAMQNSNATR